MPRYYMNYLIGALLILMGQGSHAQDIHFTNFRMAPVSVNPSFTGAFKGTYRISTIYRDQWRSIGNSRPYTTPFISAEVNIAQGLLTDNDWIAGGISFVRDQAGSTIFQQVQFGINGAYHYAVDDDYSQVFSLGVTYGRGSQRFNNQSVTLPLDLVAGGAVEMFNVDQDGNVSSNFADYTIGVSLKNVLNDQGDLIRIGVTAAHITSPNVSFVTVSAPTPQPGMMPPTVTPINDRRVGFERRLTVTGEGSFLAAENVRINPALILQRRAASTELAVQGIADYLLDPKAGVIVSGGLGYRVGDAAELIGGIQLKDLRIGLSYDLTLSSLNRAGGGAFEIAVGYIGRIYKQPDVKSVIFCPQL